MQWVNRFFSHSYQVNEGGTIGWSVDAFLFGQGNGSVADESI